MIRRLTNVSASDYSILTTGNHLETCLLSIYPHIESVTCSARFAMRSLQWEVCNVKVVMRSLWCEVFNPKSAIRNLQCKVGTAATSRSPGTLWPTREATARSNASLAKLTVHRTVSSTHFICRYPHYRLSISLGWSASISRANLAPLT